MSSTGIYPNWKQRRYVDKKANEALVRAVLAVVPKGKKIVDLGAGCGWYVERLMGEGYDVTGIDGTSGIWSLSDGRVIQHDLLNDESLSPFHGKYDWALFNDVGEHVPREHEQTLIDNVCQIPVEGMLVSWGFPHERGWNHVNCRTQVHVACEFAKRGWWPSDELTQRARDASQFKFHHVRLFVVVRKNR